MAKIVSDTRARQGGSGRPVLVVLIASLILLAIYMIWLMGWVGVTTPPNPQPSNAPAASSSKTSGVPAGNPAYPVPAAPAAGTPGSAPPPATR